MKLRKSFLCIAALTILLSGCGLVDRLSLSERDTQVENSEIKTPRPAIEDERIYTIPLGGDAWNPDEILSLDRDGNVVIPIEEPILEYTEFDLIDLVTDELRYRYRVREEIIRDAEGYPRTHRMRSLYDLDGNQLLDWENKTYESAFGEYILRQDSRDGIVSADEIPHGYHTALYHVPTGMESFVDTFQVGKLDGDIFLLSDRWSEPLGVVDSEARSVIDFPLQKQYYGAYIWNGYIIAGNTNPYEYTKEKTHIQYLLDSNFRELLVAEWISGYYGHLDSEYLAFRNGENWGIFHKDDGVIFSTDGASIEYFDGEIAIVQTGSYRGDEPISAALVTAEYKEIIGSFLWLTPVREYDDETPAEKFVGLLDGKAVLIDRAGNILASSPEIPYARSINMLCDGLYTYYVEDNQLYGTGLLGPDMEILIPTGRYSWISLATGFYSGSEDWDGRAESSLLEAQKEIGDFNTPGGMIYRSDILDHTGKIIVENVSEIYGTSPDRIVLKRGFDVGLMDWDGNWIFKRRFFTGFGND